MRAVAGLCFAAILAWSWSSRAADVPGMPEALRLRVLRAQRDFLLARTALDAVSGEAQNACAKLDKVFNPDVADCVVPVAPKAEEKK